MYSEVLLLDLFRVRYAILSTQSNQECSQDISNFHDKELGQYFNKPFEVKVMRFII